MPPTSATIGALAGALAKAQLDLANPEKSLTATIPVPEGGERSFRYAPLSSGLDVVRKSLGQHEIATIQTTSIDTNAGLVRLTTVLAHASGEWIASEFPVCPLADTAAPHRLGAALTYARRYALFTLVGIAGEDDVDAPDLLRADRRPPAQISGAKPSGNTVTARANGGAPLAAEQSAALRIEFEGELPQLTSADELTAWASRILPLKHSLTKDDAEALERAFTNRLSSLEADTAPVGSPALGQAEAAVAAPAPAPRLRRITPVLKTPRRRDKRHLRFVGTQPCLVCGRTPSDAHHLRFAEPRALGRKVSDEFTVPLCRGHHRSLHATGNEPDWWNNVRIDPLPVAQRLWAETR